jgi:hypothetical protein
MIICIKNVKKILGKSYGIALVGKESGGMKLYKDN